MQDVLRDDPSRNLISRTFNLMHRGAKYRIFKDANSIACIVVYFTDLYQIGIWVRSDLRGRGLARARLRQSLAEIPKGPLFAVIEKANTASISLFTACGFRRLSSRHSKCDKIAFSLQVR